MHLNLGWLVYFVIGTLGGLCGSRLKIPAGGLIGAMLAVMIYKVIGKSNWPIPKEIGFIFQVALGVMVGAAFQPSMLPHLKKVFIPILTSTLTLVGVGVILSIIFTRLQLLDGSTAYLGTSPGAMSGIIVLALEGGANAPLVVAFHFFRVVFVLLTTPLILHFISPYR